MGVTWPQTKGHQGSLVNTRSWRREEGVYLGPSGGAKPCSHLDFGPVASKTIVLAPPPPPVCGHLLQQPQDTDTQSAIRPQWHWEIVGSGLTGGEPWGSEVWSSGGPEIRLQRGRATWVAVC